MKDIGLNFGTTYFQNPVKAVSTTLWNSILSLTKIATKPFQLDDTIFPKIKKDATLTFTRDREYL
jgi:hypothetical protein